VRPISIRSLKLGILFSHFFLIRYMSNFLIMFELGGAEAPWGARIERAIREAISEKSGKEGSAAIAERVKSLGLRPYRPPEALPPRRRR